MQADDELIMVLVRGDREVNDVEGTTCSSMPHHRYGGRRSHCFSNWCPSGFSGPVGLKNVKIYADLELQGRTGLACGANEDGYHYVHVEYGT